MYHLFIDETGNIGPGASNRHTQRYLNLTGVIISDDAKPDLYNHFDTIRSDHFGHTPLRPIVMHRVKLNSGRGIYENLRDENARIAWESDFVGLLGLADYSVISVTLDKVAFYYHHPKWVGEPYDLCAFNMIERFCLFLRHKKAIGTVHLEAINPKPDQLFKEAFARFSTEGSRYFGKSEARHLLGHSPANLWQKNDDVIGCQLADFLCQPMLEASIARYVGPIKTSDWHKKIVTWSWSKLYRGKHNKIDGCGLVWRPQQNALPVAGRPA
jgi:hypothetical protein